MKVDLSPGWEKRSNAREAARRRARPRKERMEPREKKPCPWCVRTGRVNDVQMIWATSKTCRFCWPVIRSLQKPPKTLLVPYKKGEDFRFEARVAQLTKLRQEAPL